MTTEDDVARRLAAELGPDVADQLRAEIDAGPTSTEIIRGFGVGEMAAVASFCWAVTQVFLDVRAKRRDEAALLADLADGLNADPRLIARFDPEKRLTLAARVVDHLLPKAFGRLTSEQVATGKAERARWIESFRAAQQMHSGVTTRSWGGGDIKMRDFVGGATLLMPFAEQDHWIVWKPIGWNPDANDGPDVVPVSVWRGFVTDLASIPWYLWSFLNKTGRYGNAAIYHDWLYWRQTCERHVADKVFERAMNDMGVGAVTRNMIYLAVRARGGSAWNDWADAKKRGEKRILKRFPDRPDITWEEWRKDANNFIDE